MSVDETKVCPACAETVKAAAKKCRHCGERLPGRREVAKARWDGPAVRFRKGFKMPDTRCCICGGREGVKLRLQHFKQRKAGSGKAVLGAVLFGVVGALIAGAAEDGETRHRHFKLALCDRCERRWKSTVTLYNSVAALGAFLPLGLAILGGQVSKQGILVGVVVGLVLWALAVVTIKLKRVNRFAVQCKDVSKTALVLLFPNHDVMDDILKEAERESQ